MELSKEDFDGIRARIYKLCGLVVPDEKKYLVLQRLGPLVQKTGCRTFAEFYRRLVADPDQSLKRAIIESMTTNETSFFRDVHPFTAFERFILPELAESLRSRRFNGAGAAGGSIRIWCAAASTGQEPYSLAMLITEFAAANRHRGINPSDFAILATDISQSVMEKAASGEYTHAEISRGLSEERRRKHLVSHGPNWKVSDRLRAMVDYRLLNLISSHGHLGNFDVIFCRNVLIYFDLQTRDRLLGQFHQMLNPGGLLVLGASETINAKAIGFEAVNFGMTCAFRRNSAKPDSPAMAGADRGKTCAFASTLS